MKDHYDEQRFYIIKVNQWQGNNKPYKWSRPVVMSLTTWNYDHETGKPLPSSEYPDTVKWQNGWGPSHQHIEFDNFEIIEDLGTVLDIEANFRELFKGVLSPKYLAQLDPTDTAGEGLDVYTSRKYYHDYSIPTEIPESLGNIGPCGWVSPAGEWFQCGYKAHRGAAKVICHILFEHDKNPEKFLEDIDWLKIADSGAVFHMEGHVNKVQIQTFQDLLAACHGNSRFTEELIDAIEDATEITEYESSTRGRRERLNASL